MHHLFAAQVAHCLAVQPLFATSTALALPAVPDLPYPTGQLVQVEATAVASYKQNLFSVQAVPAPAPHTA